MANKLTLKLLADSYDQRQPDANGNITRDSELRAYGKGDVFEAQTQGEYDRLIEAGAALDPEAAQEREEQELRDRRARLEAEREQLDAQLAALDSSGSGDGLEDLKRDELNDRARQAGVPDPEALPNKDAVVAAIRSAQSPPS